VVRPVQSGVRWGGKATRTPCPAEAREFDGRPRVQRLGRRKTGRAWRRDAGNSRIPASPRERSDARGRGAPGEELADQKLQRSEVAVGQVLEAPAARRDGVVGSGEAPDDLRQVLGVLA